MVSTLTRDADRNPGPADNDGSTRQTAPASHRSRASAAGVRVDNAAARGRGNAQPGLVATLSAEAQLLVVQVDGTPGYPPRGFCGIGVVVRNLAGSIVHVQTARAEAATSVEAEYQAIIAGLALMHQRHPGLAIRVLSDSRVVVDQLCKRAAVRAARLQAFHSKALELVGQFERIELRAIPRELNRLADALAWEAVGGRRRIVDF